VLLGFPSERKNELQQLVFLCFHWFYAKKQGLRIISGAPAFPVLPAEQLDIGIDGFPDDADGGGTVLEIKELQADGGKRLKAADYLRGHPVAL